MQQSPMLVFRGNMLKYYMRQVIELFTRVKPRCVRITPYCFPCQFHDKIKIEIAIYYGNAVVANFTHKT